VWGKGTDYCLVYKVKLSSFSTDNHSPLTLLDLETLGEKRGRWIAMGLSVEFWKWSGAVSEADPEF
jgi:hypothetical protein